MEKKEIEAPKTVHGFKIFKHDWTCMGKQYTCPGRFIEEGKLEVCGHGMHFCQTANDCFNYYSFDSRNKVAEVIAYGEVVTDGDKSCTDKLEIVREIPWEEVLRIVNTGKNCTGRCNTGNWNTGELEHREPQHRALQHRESQRRRLEHWGLEHWDFNTGNCNTGDWNTGECNTGECNTGHCNTGNRNAGDCNTGDWNKSSFNVGCFNTEEQKIMLFNKSSDMTYREWLESDARWLLNQMPKNVVEWVYESDMSDEEKAEHQTYETTGGYIKVMEKSESGQLWWNDLPDDKKAVIKSLPNFDAGIFEQCTGIKIN